MSTTNLYVEQIVIGLETLLWMVFLSFWMTNEQFVNNTIALLNKIPIAIILLAACYVIGIIVDRFADKTFSFVNEKYKKRYTPNRDFSVDLFAEYNHLEFFHYSQSRKRILRASILNIPFLAIFTSLFVYRYCFHAGLILLITGTGLTTTIGAFLSLCSVYDKYYKRANELAKMKESDRKNK